MSFKCKAFSQLVTKGERPLVGGTISGLVVLGSIREQAEQGRGSKPVRNVPPWPLHQLLGGASQRAINCESQLRSPPLILGPLPYPRSLPQPGDALHLPTPVSCRFLFILMAKEGNLIEKIPP